MDRYDITNKPLSRYIKGLNYNESEEYFLDKYRDNLHNSKIYRRIVLNLKYLYRQKRIEGGLGFFLTVLLSDVFGEEANTPQEIFQDIAKYAEKHKWRNK